MFEAIHEQRPVRQLGERIVERLIAELLYQGFACGDVPGVDHHTPHSRVVKQVVYDMLKVAPRAILVGHSELQGRVKPRSFQDLGERVQRLLPVVRMDRAECVGPYLLFRLVARHPLDCRAYVVDGSVGVEDCNDIGAVLYQRAETLLALLDNFLDLLALGYVLDLGDEVERFALSIPDEGNAQRSPHRVAISVEKALLQVVPEELAFHNPARVSRTGCQIVGVGDLLPREGLQLFLSVPEYLAKRAVHLHVSSLEADHGHTDRCVIEDASEAISCLAQRILGSLALRYVADHTREQPFAILISFTEGHLDRELAAVFSQPHELGRAAHYVRFPRSQVTVEPGHTEIPVSFGHKQRDRLPDDLFCPVAEDAFCPTIEPPDYPVDYPVRRYGHDRVEGRIQNGAVARLAFS